ncbi:MAG TPA: MgtC/SapB family protein [Pseudonocardia sp.]|jgi:putative Mg2+ transporter-C (MgtC) family protein|nr:MgtC/SapB family protein [Pseudonocardia sp.]
MGGADVEFVLRLLLATGCGLLIGLERQYRSRTAGLRTHALVAAGAAVFVQFGEQAGVAAAPLQITAYVVSGVGFLGGGVILRQGFTVQGLNTAATLWCSAAIGCQAAAGHVVPALATTAVVLAVHLLVRPLGRLLDRVPAAKEEAIGAYVIVLVARRKHEPQLRAQLLQALSEPNFTLRGLSSLAGGSSDDSPASGTSSVELRADVLVEGTPASALDALAARLSLEPGIQSVSWQSLDPDPRGDDERDDDRDDGGPRGRSSGSRRWDPWRMMGH